MKKLLFFLLLAVLMCACGGKKEVKQTTDESVWDTPMEVVQEPEPVDTVALNLSSGYKLP